MRIFWKKVVKSAAASGSASRAPRCNYSLLLQRFVEFVSTT